MGQEALSEAEAEALQSALQELIHRNGEVREEARMRRLEGDGPPDTFAADLIFREPGGFELWLGSFEDALALKDLRQRGINAILNCAVEECDRECQAARGFGGGRRRAHARGISAYESADPSLAGGEDDGCSLDRDVIRTLAQFDADWYSQMLGYDTAFLGIAADDMDGYSMDDHFSEAASFLRQCREENRKVIVHCIMGINRSSAAMAAFLCQEMRLGLTPAVDMISKYRGHVLSNGSFLRQLVAVYGNDKAPA